MNRWMKFLVDKQYRFEVLDRRGKFNAWSDEKYLKRKYQNTFGEKLDLNNPKTFNQKLQWLKLNDRNPIYTTMVDKFEVKKFISERIGEEYIIPTLGVWDNFDEIDFDSLPNQFVLKCTHDSGGLVIVRDKSNMDLDATRKKVNKSLARNYYLKGREWPYKNVQPRIIAEKYITTDMNKAINRHPEAPITCEDLQSEIGLLDYKFLCFNGKVRALFLDIGVIGNSDGHADEYYRNVYDRDGTLLPVLETRENYPVQIILPDNLEEMIKLAETLSSNIPHLRVDLYRLSNGEVKVGELTFYHGSGLSNVFVPSKWDEIFGDWIELPNK